MAALPGSTGVPIACRGPTVAAIGVLRQPSVRCLDEVEGNTVLQRFPFAFDPRFTRLLMLLGVRPSTSEVLLTDHVLDVHYGPWRLQTPRQNIADVTRTGPFVPLKVIGPHVSAADRGVTFGTSADRGVCVTFHEPVGAMLGRRLLRHPGMTVTVEQPDEFLAALTG